MGLCGSLRVSASFGGSWWFSAVLSGYKLDSVGLSGSRWFSVGSVSQCPDIAHGKLQGNFSILK